MKIKESRKFKTRVKNYSVIFFVLGFTFFFISFSQSAYSQSSAKKKKSSNSDLAGLYGLDGLPSPPKVPEGFIPWDKLLKNDKSLADLNGTKVKVQGYMFPLEESDEQAHFLLSVYPPSCPFCYPAGPSGLIEINLDKPIQFSQELVKVEGTIEFPKSDPMGMLYRIRNGVRLK